MLYDIGIKLFASAVCQGHRFWYLEAHQKLCSALKNLIVNGLLCCDLFQSILVFFGFSGEILMSVSLLVRTQEHVNDAGSERK